MLNILIIYNPIFQLIKNYNNNKIKIKKNEGN